MEIVRLILDYFTLEREFALPPNIGTNIPMPADLTEPLPLVWQLALYLALLAGISLDASQPTLVQIALVFAAGLGYQSAFMALLAPASTQRRRPARRTNSKKRSSK